MSLSLDILNHRITHTAHLEDHRHILTLISHQTAMEVGRRFPNQQQMGFEAASGKKPAPRLPSNDERNSSTNTLQFEYVDACCLFEASIASILP